MCKFAFDFINLLNLPLSRMVIDIAAHISFLLYQYDTVVLPGLGKLSSTYKPATLDHIQGVLHPPAKTIHFEENAEGENDSMLQSLAEKHHINTTQAGILLDDYIHSVRNALSFQEEVDIPKVGKLYKDYEQQVRFIAYDTNFNSTSFGLPQLKYQPIVRTNEARKMSAMEPAPTSDNRRESVTVEPSTPAMPALPPLPPKVSSGSKLIWLVPVILAVLVAYLGLRWYSAKRQLLAENAQMQAAAAADREPAMELGNKSVEQDNILENNEVGQVPDENLAIIPEDSAPITSSKNTEPEVVKVEKQPKEAKSHEVKSETRKGKFRQCIVISGVFKNVANQQNMAKTLSERGFEVYTDQKKDLFRVGIQFNYSNSADLAANVTSVKRFVPGSWVYKK